MAKSNEAIEELADEVFSLNGKYEALAQTLGEIRTSLTTIVEVISNNMSEPKICIDYGEIKSNTKNALNEWYQQQSSPKKFDYTELGNIVIEKFKELENERAVLSNKQLIERRTDLDKKREAQGFLAVEQTEEWASEYPYAVRCLMRFMGCALFGEDEDPDMMKSCVKVLGDIMATASKKEEPTVQLLLKTRWEKFKRRTDKWRWWEWYLVILGMIATALMHFAYLTRVMKLDQDNQIFYQYIQKDPVLKERYHELDSLVHENSVLKRVWRVE